jgi:hypothetical protein
MRTRSTPAHGRTLLFTLLAFGLAGPGLSHGEAVAGDAATPSSKAAVKKVSKKQKALINMVEHVSFPHEEVQTHALVTVPKQPPASVGLRRAGARSRGPAHPRVIDAQPGVALDPTPTPAPAPTRAAPVAAAPPRPSGPEPTSRPHDVAPETRNEIDAMLGKAFVKPGVAAAAPEPTAPVASGTAPDTDEIATAMKPLRAEVKAGCPFGRRGVITVRVEVASDGHVANVTPEGPLAEQPSAACVLDAVRRTRFPASAGSSFRYPFAVK